MSKIHGHNTQPMDNLFRIPLLAASCITAIACSASNYSVKGTVVESTTTEALPGATYSIYAANDTVRPLLTGIADAEGNFSQQLQKAGEYFVKIKFTGFNDKDIPFLISANHADAMLGTIALQPQAELLSEVTVTAQKPIIEANGEKVGYNVDQDPSSGTKTVLEMLRKVPSVTVDGQDNIRVNGQSNFKIYVNGKENPMLSANASTVLKSMPANAVKKIEVILEPGAKYDAEGVGGILNLITETKTDFDGYLATVSAGISNRNSQFSVYGRTRTNKVTQSLNVSYYQSFPMKTNTDVARDYYDDARNLTSQMDQQGEFNMRNKFLNGSYQLSWEPDTTNLFTLDVSGMGGTSNNTTNTTSNTSIVQTSLTNRERQWAKMSSTWMSLTASASYQHTFTPETNFLVLSYQYVYGLEKNKSRSIYTEYDPATILSPFSRSSERNPSNEHTAMMDYTRVFSPLFTLETGAKGIFRRNFGHGSTFTGTGWDNMVPENDNAINMNQFQDVAAVYASYTGSLDKFTLKAGARYEYTHMAVKFKQGDYNNFSTDLNDFVPNVALSYNPLPARAIRLSYQMRIRRPGISELNPHSTMIITDLYSKGNPDLVSEKTHKLALSYTTFTGKLGGSLSADYSWSKNSIINVIEVDGQTLNYTFANAGDTRSCNISGFLRWQPVSVFDISINGSARYTYFDLHNGRKPHGWSYWLGGNFNYSLPWNLSVSGYGGFSTRSKNSLGWMGGFRYYGLSITRKFLPEDRLSVSINGNNFASSHMTFKNGTESDNLLSKATMKMPGWSVGISVSYTLGSLKSGIKKTASSIVNDDVNSSQGGSSMGGTSTPTL